MNVSPLVFANRWEKIKMIEQSLYHEKWVIVDRYVLSGIVYTRALDSTIPSEWLCNVDRGLPIQDITFYLYRSDLDYRKRGELYERKEFQDLVKKEYELVSTHATTQHFCGRWIPIDSLGTKDETFKLILEQLQQIKL